MTLDTPDAQWAVTAATPAHCWMCGAQTRLVSHAFEAPTCSGDCEDEAWRQYAEAEAEHAIYWPITDTPERREARPMVDVLPDLADWPHP